MSKVLSAHKTKNLETKRQVKETYVPCDLSSMLVCWNGESLRTEGTSPFGRRIGKCVKEHVHALSQEESPVFQSDRCPRMSIIMPGARPG
jgi:hypothetical protein